MNPNEHLKELVCSAVDINQSHYVDQPISLQCGHVICKSCIPVARKESFECRKCGHVNNRELIKNKESLATQALIRVCLPDLFVDIEAKFREGIALLKNQLEHKLKDELTGIVKQFKDHSTSNIKNRNFENELEELMNDLKNNETRNEKRFYNHQENLKCLRESLRKIEESIQNNKMTFTPSEFKPDTISIGNLLFDKKIPTLIETLKEKLTISKHETIKSNDLMFHLCSLPDNRFVSMNTTKITIYDENFSVIKVVDKIDNQFLRLCGMSLNSKNELYVLDELNIFKFDANLNKIKSLHSDTWKYPRNPCFKNDRLYVFDLANCRIQIYNDNLECIDTIKVDHCPFASAVIDNTIAVHLYSKGLYFYNLNTKELKYKYEDILGRINEIDSKFYVTSYSKKLFIFDKEGALIEEISLHRFKDAIQHNLDGHILYVNENLCMISHTLGQVLKF